MVVGEVAVAVAEEVAGLLRPMQHHLAEVAGDAVSGFALVRLLCFLLPSRPFSSLLCQAPRYHIELPSSARTASLR